MTLIFSVLDDITLLPWFLKYYEDNGVTRFLCTVHDGKKNWLWRELQKFAVCHPLQLFECKPEAFGGMYTSASTAAAQDTLRERIQDGFYMLADLDEFIYFPGINFGKAAIGLQGTDYIYGQMLDRVTEDGHLPGTNELLDAPSLDSLFRRYCPITERVIGGNTGKVVMAKAHVPIGSGHHFGQGKQSTIVAEVHHFKWLINVLERSAFRKDVLAAAGVTYKDEPVRLLQHIAENKGRINIQQIGTEPARHIGI